jgi:hypothetical protein
MRCVKALWLKAYLWSHEDDRFPAFANLHLLTSLPIRFSPSSTLFCALSFYANTRLHLQIATISLAIYFVFIDTSLLLQTVYTTACNDIDEEDVDLNY